MCCPFPSDMTFIGSRVHKISHLLIGGTFSASLPKDRSREWNRLEGIVLDCTEVVQIRDCISTTMKVLFTLILILILIDKRARMSPVNRTLPLCQRKPRTKLLREDAGVGGVGVAFEPVLILAAAAVVAVVVRVLVNQNCVRTFPHNEHNTAKTPITNQSTMERRWVYPFCATVLVFCRSCVVSLVDATTAWFLLSPSMPTVKIESHTAQRLLLSIPTLLATNHHSS